MTGGDLMTKPKEFADLQRPRTVLGRFVRLYVRCPLCRSPVGVMKYRRHSVRVKCKRQECGLRHTIDLDELAEVLIFSDNEFAQAAGQVLIRSRKFHARAVHQNKEETVGH